jgi:hypothetical protein
VPGEIFIERPEFRVRIAPDSGRFFIDVGAFTQEFRADIGVDSLAAFDRTVDVTWRGSDSRLDHERVTWAATSSLWRKQLYLDVYQGHAEFSADVLGDGDVDSVRYFDTIHDAGHVPHFALTKHFNDKGQTDARDYSTGSPVAFTDVFCPLSL